MDTKITVSFDEAVIKKAKQYAEANNISLSRMIEFLLKKITSSHYSTMADYPCAMGATVSRRRSCLPNQRTK